MNKKVMVIWGIIVIGILANILLIGYNHQDQTYTSLKNNLKIATKNYMIDRKVKLDFNESFVIFVSDLKKDKYINDKEENIEKYCVDRIVYTKGLIHDNYEIVKDCK